MKITDVKCHLLKKELSSSMRISRGGFETRYHLIVEVLTDEGISGLGEGIGTAHYVKGIIENKMRDLALGLDPRNIETIREKLLDNQVYFERGGSAVCAASAIEMACWDIKAKALSVPLYELLGGKFREEVEVYASNIYWHEDLGQIISETEELLYRGIKNIKAHIGCRDPKNDLYIVRALRETIGDDGKLMIDLNCGYSYPMALRACELWAPFDIFWLEEPLSPYSLNKIKDLKQHTNIPIAWGENEFRSTGFQDLFARGLVDYAMPDIGRVGGILETKMICKMAAQRGVLVTPHNYSSGVLLAATLHLMASEPNSYLLEYDGSNNAVYREFFPEFPRLADGRMSIPSQPGLGVELNDDVLKYKVN